jgi:hypothetical protein
MNMRFRVDVSKGKDEVYIRADDKDDTKGGGAVSITLTVEQARALADVINFCEIRCPKDGSFGAEIVAMNPLTPASDE